MKVTKSQLKRVIKEELQAVLNEQGPDPAMKAIRLILQYLPSTAKANVRETQGYIYSGGASVENGMVGLYLNPSAEAVSPAGGSAAAPANVEQVKINPANVLNELGENRGLRRQLKEAGIQLTSFDKSAPVKYKFRGGSESRGVWGGYEITPA